MKRNLQPISFAMALVAAVSILTASSRHRSRAHHAVDMPPTASSALLARLAGARTTAHPQPLVITEGGKEKTVCGPLGDSRGAKAQALNANKNRTDKASAGAYIPVGWTDLKTLPASRAGEYEGAPVAVEGYLSHQIKVETAPPGESTNCHLHQKNEVDWHMYLTDQPHQGIVDAIIVETTPRTRPEHSWTPAKLEEYLNSSTRMRISGWLLYDYEHADVVGKHRATAWEVHPITRIEVQDRAGHWVDIEKR